MLFSKPISDLTFEDVEEFCKRFRENIRVEYKASFDDSVKRKLPRVLSSFANSYGGILIIGINAPAGIPQEPFEGIVFPEREPGLTVQQICRDGIFPEIPLYTSVVPSRRPDRAFLVAQVEESPKAPHAIENTTKVYVRVGEGTESSTLADIPRIERLLLRRGEVLQRWNEFFRHSWSFANAANLRQDSPFFEIKIGPQYPSEYLVTRERVYEFLERPDVRAYTGFNVSYQLLRTPIGALLVRDDHLRKFLNLGDLGVVHYVEPLYETSYPGQPKGVLDLWSIAIPILRVLRLYSFFVKYANLTSELRVEVILQKISGKSFMSSPNPIWSLQISTLASAVPALTSISSEDLAESLLETTIELMYQLRWPFGVEPAPPLAEVRRVVEGITKSA